MLKQTNPVTKTLLWMLIAVVLLFLGGWALTTWVTAINWSLQAIAGIAALVACLIGEAIMFAARD